MWVQEGSDRTNFWWTGNRNWHSRGSVTAAWLSVGTGQLTTALTFSGCVLIEPGDIMYPRNHTLDLFQGRPRFTWKGWSHVRQGFVIPATLSCQSAETDGVRLPRAWAASWTVVDWPKTWVKAAEKAVTESQVGNCLAHSPVSVRELCVWG